MRSITFRMQWGAAIAALVMCAVPAALVAADGPGTAGELPAAESSEPAAAAADWTGAEPAEPEFRFGPGPGESRGTLFQWSYGTSFGGGPPLDGPLETDRPDFTEAGTTVGKGVLQVEAGYTYIYDADGTTSVRTQSFGEPLFRYGVFADWLEFRLAVFPVEERTVTGGARTRTAGTEDLYLGFKIALTPQEGLLPEMALIPQATVPTGSNAFTNDEMHPGVNWIYAWEINDFLSTAGSTQVNRARDTGGALPIAGPIIHAGSAGGRATTYYEFAQSWTVAYSLSERLGAYTEWFAIIPSGAETAQTQHYADGGFTYLLSDDVQFDVRAGKGLNSAADDYFVGTGLSVRFR
ncbi:MAG: transporter [Planctomycetales bacterium]